MTLGPTIKGLQTLDPTSIIISLLVSLCSGSVSSIKPWDPLQTLCSLGLKPNMLQHGTQWINCGHNINISGSQHNYYRKIMSRRCIYLMSSTVNILLLHKNMERHLLVFFFLLNNAVPAAALGKSCRIKTVNMLLLYFMVFLYLLLFQEQHGLY